MYRFIILLADVLPSAVILLLVLLLWLLASPQGRSHSVSQKLGIILFTIYLPTICSTVGIPAITSLHPDFSLNLLPLLDMAQDSLRSCVLNALNILLFVPLGLLLPAIWPQYRSLRRTALAGLALSLSIELAQLFCWRLTDIDDLIMNTLGAAAGFYLLQYLYQAIYKRPIEQSREAISWEPWLIWLACLIIVIFIYPFLPEDIRNWFLYTPFWH